MNFNDGNNGWRMSNRKTVQTLVILTILAWATQTLIHQWGFGQTPPDSQGDAQVESNQSAVATPVNQPAPANQSATDQSAVDPAGGDGLAPLGASPAAMPTEPQAPGAERFVPGDAGAEPIIGTLELRSEATITGDTAALRSLCRWSNADAAAFAPIADLTIVHFPAGVPFKNVRVEDIRQTLHDAGVNVAMINFVGAGSCTVSREDVQVDQRQALQDWIDARQGGAKADASPADDSATAAPIPAPVQPVAAPAATAPSASADKPRTLRDQLLADAATRLDLPIESLQITFNPADEKLLALAEPLFRFNITPQHLFDLGAISWNVDIVTDDGSKNVTLSATARAWQTQLIVNKPLAFKEVIQPSDFDEKRTLVDHLTTDTVLTAPQAVGMQAASDIKPGVILTARMVDPVPLCKTGELITVTVTQGGVHLRMVARAMEPGAYGQTIHARNEMNDETLEVVMTGPEQARLGPDTTASAAN